MIQILSLEQVHLKNGSCNRLSGINLKINIGERIALLGSSGAGKSSLISIANGSVKPDRGEVRLRGKKLSQLKHRERQLIGTLWQDLRLIEELNVCQNINTGALGRHNLLWAVSNLIGSIETNLCIQYLEAVGLPKKFLTSQVQDLSGGQRQRVAIARTLRQEAELLLADEPFSNLDPTLVDEIINLLLGKKGCNAIPIPDTILISLHRPELIKHFTRVIGLIEGEIILDRPSKGLDPSDLQFLYKDR